MDFKLTDAEHKVMEVLWREGDTTAKRVSEILREQIGWSKTSTYTMIKRCFDKGAIERREPNWVCHPLITIEDAREFETTELINKMFYGATDRLVASILERKTLSKEDIERLKQIIQELE
jgi:predicted transcriptional regulator